MCENGAGGGWDRRALSDITVAIERLDTVLSFLAAAERSVHVQTQTALVVEARRTAQEARNAAGRARTRLDPEREP